MGATVKSHQGNTELNIDYRPSVVAQQFIEDPVFVSGFFGPLGSGKSTAGTMKSFIYSQAWPGARIAIIRDTYPNLIDTTQRTFFEWLPEGPAGTYTRTNRTFYLRTVDPNKPAEIIFRAMDQKDDVSNILSLDLAAAWMDEPQGGLALTSGNSMAREPGIDHELFLLTLSRIGRQKGYKPMCWLTGNPPPPSHWIAKDFGYVGYGLPLNPNPDYHLYLGTQDTNRTNLTEGYYERLERLFGKSTPLARRFLDGEWIEFAQINPFHASWITYYGPGQDDELPEDLIIEMGFDPAISEKDSANKSALVIAGQAREGLNRGRIYVLGAIAGHWSVYEQVDQIIKAAQKYKARVIRIEDVQYQKALKDILEHEFRQRGVNNLYVHLVKPDGDKIRRASGWSPWVESGTVLFTKDQKVLIDCMLSVPGDKTAWDLVDAAGICIRGFPALQSESERIKGSEFSTPDRAASYSTQRDTKPKFLKSTLLANPEARRARSYSTNLVTRQGFR